MTQHSNTQRAVDGASFHLPLKNDFIDVAAALVASMKDVAVSDALFGNSDFMLYEKNETFRFAAAPCLSLTMTARRIVVRDGRTIHELPLGEDPLETVQNALQRFGNEAGWRAYGWTAFELSSLLHGETVADLDMPLLHLMIPTHEIILGQGAAEISVQDAQLADIWQEVLTAPATDRPSARIEMDLSQGGDEYKTSASDAIDAIDGNIFRKLILSRRVPVTQPVNMVETYRAMRHANTPARSFLFQLSGLTVAGVSPGAIVEVDQSGCVSTQPLAGTRARGITEAETETLRQDLLSDPKEIYEHALSVQLACAEVARVCVPETVVVRDFMDVIARGSVQHIASTVQGQLTGGNDAWAAFASLFPPVTTSGIPKARARAEITARESAARGVYSGAVLMLDSDGCLDAALAIRSVIEQDGQAWLRAGAGLIVGAKAARELEETNEKLRSVSRFLVPCDGSASGEE